MGKPTVAQLRPRVARKPPPEGEPLIAPTGIVSVDAVADVVNRTVDPFRNAPPPEQGTVGAISHYVSAGLGVVGAPFEMLDAGFATATSGIAALFPSLPAATLLAPHLGMPHGHSHPPSLIPPAPPVPLPSIGAVMGAGALGVLVGGIPAARASDVGLAPTCGSLGPAFEIYTGSSNVFVGGSRAARMFDITRHCNPASAMGAIGKVMGAAGVAAGALSAGAQAAGGNALAAGMAAAQAAADAAALAMSALLGKDPGLPPAMGAVMLGNPTVLVGGFPMPDVLELLGGLMKAVKGALGKLKKPKGKVKKVKCNDPGEPIELVSGVVYNDFLDFEEPDGLRWFRHYRSDWGDRIGPLGPGYRHFYQRRLVLLRKRVVLEEWNGESFELERADEGSPSGWVDGRRIEVRDDRYFVLVHGDERWTFERCGSEDDEARPVCFVGPRGDVLLHYDDAGRLVWLADHRPVGVANLYLHWTGERIGLVEFGWQGGPRTPVLRYEYDSAGRLDRCIDALNTVEHFSYDAAGRMLRYVNRIGYAFSWRYDGDGRCVLCEGQDGLWRASMRYEIGRTIVHKANGGEWIYGYDDNQILRTVIDPYGGALIYETDEVGRIVGELQPGGERWRWLYDETGIHVGRMDPFGTVYPPLDVDPDPPELVTQLPPQSPFEWCMGQAMAALPSPLVLSVPSSVDALLVSVFGSATAANVRPQPPRHDVRGQVAVELDASGAQRLLERDAEGNVVVERDLEGQPWFYGYESWNLRTSQRDPSGSIVRWRYDAHQEIAAIVDPLGAVSQYEHDLRDRLSRVIRHGRQRERYEYDLGDRLIAKYGHDDEVLVRYEIGRDGLTSVIATATGERHELVHDRFGNVEHATGPLGELYLEWDEGERRELDLREGLGVRHRLEGDQLLSTVYFERFAVEYRDFGNGEWRIFTPGGRRHGFWRSETGYVSAELGNGSRELSHFDHRGRCSGKIEWRGEGVHALVHRSICNRYSPEGELREIIDSDRGPIRHDYDPAHRVVAQHRLAQGHSVHYVYDRAGNLISAPGIAELRYDEGNRLAQIDGRFVTHDARQRLATRIEPDGSVACFEYDDLDRLVRVWWKGRDMEWRAGYDSLGRRVLKQLGDKRWEYWWDGDRLAVELRPDRSLRLYVYPNADARVPFMLLDYEGIDADPASGRAYYVFTDQVGTPSHVEDERGEIVWWVDVIEPYGCVHVRPDSRLELALRFPGHYADDELGLFYNRFRYYDPALGRYISPDPAGQGAGINLYAYAANPLVDVDLDGLHPPKKDAKPNRKRKRAGEPESESPGPEQKKQKTKKPLAEMTPDELDAHAKALAEKINKKYVGKGRDANTFCVTVVQQKGKPATRKLVVTSNLNNKKPPKRLRSLLKSEGAEWRNKGPDLVKRRPVPEAPSSSQKKRVRGDDGSTKTSTKKKTQWEEAPKGEFFERKKKPDGTPEYTSYTKRNQDNPDGESRHHAEQRMTNALEKGEEPVTIAPSRKCCDGCRAALKDKKLLNKVPKELRGDP